MAPPSISKFKLDKSEPLKAEAKAPIFASFKITHSLQNALSLRVVFSLILYREGKIYEQKEKAFTTAQQQPDKYTQNTLLSDSVCSFSLFFVVRERGNSGKADVYIFCLKHFLSGGEKKESRI